MRVASLASVLILAIALPASAQLVEIAAFDSARVGPLTLSFDKLVGDSRCPIDAVCIWEGDGVIDLVVDSDRSEPATFELHTNRGFQYFAEYDGFTITLIALKPDPLTYVLPSPEDYVAMLFVTSSFVPTETTSWSAMKARF